MKLTDSGRPSPEWVRPIVSLAATLVGAGLGLGIGIIFVSRGFLAGLFVLLLTILGAVAGKFYAAAENSF